MDELQVLLRSPTMYQVSFVDACQKLAVINTPSAWTAVRIARAMRRQGYRTRLWWIGAKRSFELRTYN